jgi:futalosine hydrolase
MGTGRGRFSGIIRDCSGQGGRLQQTGGGSAAEACVSGPKNRVIGAVSAVPSEGDFIASRLKPLERRAVGPLRAYKGMVGSWELVYVISGIGKTNAAHATALLAREYPLSLVIGFGVGGAYPGKGLKVGDIAVATKEVYADEGVLLKDGFHPLNVIRIPLVRLPRRRLFNEFPLDRHLSRAALRSSRHVANAKAGTFNTVSLCTGTETRAKELSERFGAICENMEGAAIAQLCSLYEVPFVEMRGISNIVEDRDIRKWDIGLAAENCQKALLEFVSSLDGTIARGECLL